MQAKIPVLAVTDSNTDIGKVILDGQFGWWCESNNADSVASTVNHIMNNPRLVNEYGENAFKYLVDNYTVENAYSIIMK